MPNYNFTRRMNDLAPLQKLPNNVGNLGKTLISRYSSDTFSWCFIGYTSHCPANLSFSYRTKYINCDFKTINLGQKNCQKSPNYNFLSMLEARFQLNLILYAASRKQIDQYETKNHHFIKNKLISIRFLSTLATHFLTLINFRPS